MDTVGLITAIAVVVLGTMFVGLVKWVKSALKEKFVSDIGNQLESQFERKWEESLTRHVSPIRIDIRDINSKVDDTRTQLADQMPPDGNEWANGSRNLHQTVGWMVGALYSIMEQNGIRSEENYKVDRDEVDRRRGKEGEWG